MLQGLQSQVENCIRAFRIRRRRMSEAAPGFQSRPNVSKVDEIVTCGNTREQRNGDQSYRNHAANSGPGRADALALRKAENCQTADGKQQPGEVENSDQLRNIITALRCLTDWHANSAGLLNVRQPPEFGFGGFTRPEYSAGIAGARKWIDQPRWPDP